MILLFINAMVLIGLTLSVINLTVIQVKKKTIKNAIWLKLIAYFCLILLWIITLDEIILEAYKDIF